MSYIWKSWPQWLTDSVIAAYLSGEHPAIIGAVLGRSENVIRGKLIREGVYVSAAAKRQAKVAEQTEGF